MQQFSSLVRGVAVGLVCVAGLAACHSDDVNQITNVVTPATGLGYVQTNLVADIAGTGAVTIDSLLVNPWGLAVGLGGSFWVANAGSGTATSYTAAGAKLGKSVVVPSPSGEAGEPTGIVRNTTHDFAIPSGSAAMFVFAGEDGAITAWDGVSDSAKIVVDRSEAGAVYKGLTMLTIGALNYLFATDFHNNRVDVFDTNFELVASFTDESLPVGYAPFGIQAISGSLFITFAKQKGPDNKDDEAGPGNGYVDLITPDGYMWRVASNGFLNSPWGIAFAPTAFGKFSGAILIGNFGDGRIGAYSSVDGAFLGFLSDANDTPVTIPGLWALAFGAAPSATLYFTAGPGGESHGIFGSVSPRSTATGSRGK